MSRAWRILVCISDVAKGDKGSGIRSDCIEETKGGLLHTGCVGRNKFTEPRSGVIGTNATVTLASVIRLDAIQPTRRHKRGS